MTKTMSIRMDRDNHDFPSEMARQDRSDFSKAVRDLVARGRVLLAVERYKKGDVSLGKAAQLAGLSMGQMMTLLAEFGVESRIDKDDYLQGLRNLAKAWQQYLEPLTPSPFAVNERPAWPYASQSPLIDCR